MTMTAALKALAAGLGLFILAGCVSGGSGDASKYATACMAEVKPVGGMVWRDGDDRVMGDNFARREGIEAMNACIARKAAGNGTSSGPMSQRSTVATDGTRVVETFTYGEPPAPSAQPAAGRGAAPKDCKVRNVMSGGTGYNACN